VQRDECVGSDAAHIVHVMKCDNNALREERGDTSSSSHNTTRLWPGEQRMEGVRCGGEKREVGGRGGGGEEVE
jgi:hypothetical protein